MSPVRGKNLQVISQSARNTASHAADLRPLLVFERSVVHVMQELRGVLDGQAPGIVAGEVVDVLSVVDDVLCKGLYVRFRKADLLQRPRKVCVPHQLEDRLRHPLRCGSDRGPIVTSIGRSDVAYKLLLNTRYPSWGYQVEHGATTMWERWNGDKMMNDPGMNSFNHYAYGAVAAWIYQYAAGIDATSADPGYHRIHLHPNFSRKLGNVDFTYQSPYGPVHSAWTAPSSGPATWDVTIPANASGFLKLSPEEARRYNMDGHALAKSSSTSNGSETFDVPSGRHEFTVAMQ